MIPLHSPLDAASRLAIAALVGMAVGLERQWSGHADGPDARFAGLRTLLILGTIGGIAGLLLVAGSAAIAVVILAGAMALVVAAYVVTVVRRGAAVDGTTEAAALAVIALGVIAGAGWMGLAAGAGSVIVLALREKNRLHGIVRHVSETELRAAFQFLVLALVVLPLLPAGPFLGTLEVRPRAIWTIVLFLSALNFAGFLARRAVGPRAGYALTGLLGGVVSSTAVTVEFSRRSRRDSELASGLAYGVIGACTVLIPRVVVMSAVLNPDVAVQVVRLLWLPAACGVAMLAIGWRRGPTSPIEPQAELASPLNLRSAIQMGLAFQAALIALVVIQREWGTTALYPTAAALGLTDMDALTVSMSRVDAGVPAAMAATGIAIGVLANTALKLGLVVGIGAPAFRRQGAFGLLVLGAATVVSLLVWA